MKTRLHPGPFWYGLSVPVEIFFAIFQDFGNISRFLQYFKIFFAIYQVVLQHFKIDLCMTISSQHDVKLTLSIFHILWTKDIKYKYIQVHSIASTEWWACLFFLLVDLWLWSADIGCLDASLNVCELKVVCPVYPVLLWLIFDLRKIVLFSPNENN